MIFEEYQGWHQDQTMLLVGNGGNLDLTPPEWFQYPSIGMNTIHKREGYKPDYYIAVDRRVAREFGGAISNRFSDLPKFVPDRIRDLWHGNNYVEFKVPAGVLWCKGRGSLWQNNFDSISYGNVMHVAIKLALHMGANRILIIGMEHNPANANAHFWGVDSGMPAHPPLPDWYEGYTHLVNGIKNSGREIFNISANTYVPEDIMPRDNFTKWRNNYGRSTTL